MRKITFLLFFSFILLCSCEQATHYTILGETDAKYNGGVVYLSVVKGDKIQHLDSTTIENGRFRFLSEQPSAAIRRLSVPAFPEVGLLDFVLEAGTLYAKIGVVSTMSGTPLNDLLQQQIKERKLFEEHRYSIQQQYLELQILGELTERSETELKVKFDAVKENYAANCFEIIKDNLDNVVGGYLFNKNYVLFSYNEIEQIRKDASATFKSVYGVEGRFKRNDVVQQTSSGNPYVNLQLYTPNGEKLSLDSLVGKGKYVVLDFWASDCAPSRRMRSSLWVINRDFSHLGVQIVSISLDKDRTKWVEAINMMQQNWIQLSDLKGWSSSAAAAYAIPYTPYIIIINPQGIICDRGVSPSNLVGRLKSLVGNPYYIKTDSTLIEKEIVE